MTTPPVLRNLLVENTDPSTSYCLSPAALVNGDATPQESSLNSPHIDRTTITPATLSEDSTLQKILKLLQSQHQPQSSPTQKTLNPPGSTATTPPPVMTSPSSHPSHSSTHNHQSHYITSDPNYPSRLSISGLIDTQSSSVTIDLNVMKTHFPKIDLYKFHQHFSQIPLCSSITLSFGSNPTIQLHTNNPPALEYNVELFFMVCILCPPV